MAGTDLGEGELLRESERENTRLELALVNSNSHVVRPVHLIITMMKWIRTSRLSITKSLCRGSERERATSRAAGACLPLTLPLSLSQEATQHGIAGTDFGEGERLRARRRANSHGRTKWSLLALKIPGEKRLFLEPFPKELGQTLETVSSCAPARRTSRGAWHGGHSHVRYISL